jgi:pyruvate,orthophosphate dikinase
MQVGAIFEAALKVGEELKIVIEPEIMIPLVAEVKELVFLRKVIEEIAGEFLKEHRQLRYRVGTMIELPRACVTAGKIATEAEFFSFGTNDLTQMSFGFSRDDAGQFLGNYYQEKVLAADPFATIDREGVGTLMKFAVASGKKARPELQLGICGEHGGDPESVEFCEQLGLDYVSCSPYRLPIARLAAAQAAVKTLNK